MIEASFDSNKLFTPKEMKEQFGKFGWEKHED
ncbi:toxin-antitoxin system, antitoxin component, AbrB family protein [Limosilactobacillus reuteri]|nr:toxin-antitoxin system, antitoxin component, AbrB family protein [Limosilactobacillus reuteri]MDD1405824.1 toxin-antitoxin system, antitoxin component, AbrB family protein [Limosilactobacillus reuteri]